MFENDNHFRRVGNKVFEGDSLKSLYDYAEKYGYYIDSTDNSSEGKDLEEFDASSGARSSASRRRNGVRSRRFVRAEDEVRERHHSSFLLFLRRADDCCDGRIH